MNCKEIGSLWEAYTNGECSPKIEQEMEEHFQTCSVCVQLLNEELQAQESALPKKKSENGNKEEQLMNVTITQQNRIIRKAKWKSRIMNVLTALGLFLFVSISCGVLTAVYYYGFGGDEAIGKRTSKVVQTATQMTMPNVYSTDISTNTNFYFNFDMNSQLQMQLGNESKTIGSLEGKMMFNWLTVNRDWSAGEYDVKLYFLHPEYVEAHLDSETDIYQENTNDIWETLEILPEGTVSEMAITFDQLYEIDDVYNILAGDDLNIPWYAIDTGTEKNGNSYGSPYLSAVTEIWGFHERSIFDFSSDGGSISTRGDGDVRADAFKTGLQFLAENEKMASQYMLGIDRDVSIEERLHFIEENGVKTYGVVVTGPTKELLKLQDNEQIIYASLGEVDFWNWNNPPAGGTIYN